MRAGGGKNERQDETLIYHFVSVGDTATGAGGAFYASYIHQFGSSLCPWWELRICSTVFWAQAERIICVIIDWTRSNELFSRELIVLSSQYNLLCTILRLFLAHVCKLCRLLQSKMICAIRVLVDLFAVTRIHWLMNTVIHQSTQNVL